MKRKSTCFVKSHRIQKKKPQPEINKQKHPKPANLCIANKTGACHLRL